MHTGDPTAGEAEAGALRGSLAWGDRDRGLSGAHCPGEAEAGALRGSLPWGGRDGGSLGLTS